jgi:hypothetical protein
MNQYVIYRDKNGYAQAQQMDAGETFEDLKTRAARAGFEIIRPYPLAGASEEDAVARFEKASSLRTEGDNVRSEPVKDDGKSDMARKLFPRSMKEQEGASRSYPAGVVSSISQYLPSIGNVADAVSLIPKAAIAGLETAPSVFSSVTKKEEFPFFGVDRDGLKQAGEKVVESIGRTPEDRNIISAVATDPVSYIPAIGGVGALSKLGRVGKTLSRYAPDAVTQSLAEYGLGETDEAGAAGGAAIGTIGGAALGKASSTIGGKLSEYGRAGIGRLVGIPIHVQNKAANPGDINDLLESGTIKYGSGLKDVYDALGGKIQLAAGKQDESIVNMPDMSRHPAEVLDQLEKKYFKLAKSKDINKDQLEEYVSLINRERDNILPLNKSAADVPDVFGSTDVLHSSQILSLKRLADRQAGWDKAHAKSSGTKVEKDFYKDYSKNLNEGLKQNTSTMLETQPGAMYAEATNELAKYIPLKDALENAMSKENNRRQIGLMDVLTGLGVGGVVANANPTLGLLTGIGATAAKSKLDEIGTQKAIYDAGKAIGSQDNWVRRYIVPATMAHEEQQ